ncbi:tetratricopeptide repeat protein [Mesobacterium sp. TK19101]|uniref:Tetratricopeptide repeat protein n=1 Tax=Mesobacterium hydrothermale TaxID=3111907 RepID=A0ABU6HDZ8_9RHOB|nr:tetratricopeptide repeat protein [Mesobacterium sp. TK19101]MEC3860337.1 tetratricopeptide repeat protein [Mesobacterium sp. TK19101]
MKRALIPLLFLAGRAFAECPAAPDHKAELFDLMTQVQAAKNDMEARKITNQMWELWADAPDEPAQSLLDDGMTARSSYDFLRALDHFNRLVDYCPDYAEGYNQRAFIHFLREDYAAALPDLERALALNPHHIAALAGKGLTLLGLGRKDEGHAALRMALALNPWLPERFLLPPPGEEL